LDLGRAYNDEGFGLATQSSLTLKATSSEFKAPTTMADLSYGLHLMLLMNGKLDKHQVNNVIDRALAWRVIEPSDEAKGRAALGNKAEARLEMKIGDEAFRAMLPRWSVTHEGELATALARALPRLDVRPGPDGRVGLYKGFWLGYMRAKAMWGEDDVLRTLKRALRDAGADAALYEFEGRSGSQGIFNVADIIRNNGTRPSLWERWNDEGYSIVPAKGLNLAMQDVLRHIEAKTLPDGYLPAMFKQSFVALGGQTFNTMALGAYILELAALKGAGAVGGAHAHGDGRQDHDRVRARALTDAAPVEPWAEPQAPEHFAPRCISVAQLGKAARAGRRAGPPSSRRCLLWR